MTLNYLPVLGDVISKSDLRISKAKEISDALEKLPYFSLIELRRITNPYEAEAVIFDTEVEIGQKTIHDIRSTERIAVIFTPEDKFVPEVLGLRPDFPLVPHLNLRQQERPRSLCLFSEKYSEVKFHWTPKYFLERIREWLALSAKGELHGDDQPLEPLLIGSPIKLIFPFDLFDGKNIDELELIIIRRADYGSNGSTLIANRQKDTPTINKEEIRFIAFPIQGRPQAHGIIYNQPANLSELHDFLDRTKIDLLNELRGFLRKFQTSHPNSNLIRAHLILIINLPKTRHSSGKPESSDMWAFWLEDTIEELGRKIGIWEKKAGGLGILIPPDYFKKGEDVKIHILDPTPYLSRELASKLNGLNRIDDRQFCLVGVGALGSQVLNNLVRMGIGNWTIIDEDCLLPHNLARHALTSIHLGYSKAEMLAAEANGMIKGEPVASSIVTDVLNPLDSFENLNSAFKEARVIIDASASIPVARHLVRDIKSRARRLSIFLNPSGSDVVILAEDEKRKLPLDCLEMQYYRYVITKPKLKTHFQRKVGSVRYARSCRDISSTIPQDLVSLHSSICCRGILSLIKQKKSRISIWKADIIDLTVTKYNVPIYEIIQRKLGPWTLCFDQFLLNKISESREEKLPNETGGVLIGSYDMQRKIVYVVDTILSPPDSFEYPTAYIRGCKGLKKRVDEIQETTIGMLNYVGEWHSHPCGFNTKLSDDDKKLFSWLKENMNIEGLPALMLIAGDKAKYSWYLENTS
ncbi:MAG: ThiF family adenylyltransferase [Thermodesulfobacteriota bacterium]